MSATVADLRARNAQLRGEVARLRAEREALARFLLKFYEAGYDDGLTGYPMPTTAEMATAVRASRTRVQGRITAARKAQLRLVPGDTR